MSLTLKFDVISHVFTRNSKPRATPSGIPAARPNAPGAQKTPSRLRIVPRSIPPASAKPDAAE